MTFIKPHNKKSILTVILACMVFIMIAGAGSLVFAYNRSMSFERGISAATAALQRQEAENARLKSGLLALFDTAHLAAFAELRSLVREKNPVYVAVDTQWRSVSGQ